MTSSFKESHRHIAGQILLAVVGMVVFCIYSRSWQDVAHLIYDIPASFAVFAFIGQLVIEIARQPLTSFAVARLMLIAVLTVICAGRDFLGWPISGHLTCVLAVALVQTADIRLPPRERFLYWLPLPIVISMRWFSFDLGQHWQTYNAIIVAALSAAPVVFFARRVGPLKTATPRKPPAESNSKQAMKSAPVRGGIAWQAAPSPKESHLKTTPNENPTVSPLITENVNFSVFAPPVVQPKVRFLLSIWAYTKEQHEEMLELANQIETVREVGTKRSVRIQRGSDIVVHVDLPSFQIDEPYDTIAWEGEVGNASFAVTGSCDIAKGKHIGTATFLCAGVPIARLPFQIEVSEGQKPGQVLDGRLDRIRSVFASYASSDRLEVAQWARGASAIGVDVFLDVMSLREGQTWETELTNHIMSCDMFCLFWSFDASTSEWVEREWRTALAQRGIDHIHPVPLSDPRDVPPPSELGSVKHFNDYYRIVIDYEKLLSKNATSGRKVR